MMNDLPPWPMGAAPVARPAPARQLNMKLKNKWQSKLPEHIASAAARGLPVVEFGRHSGARGAVVCGSGPSLLKPAVLRELREYQRKKWVFIACKESIRLLSERGFDLTYSVSMDPAEHQVEKTKLVEGITYLLAVSCNPVLFDHCLSAGNNVELFMSACGARDEERGMCEVDLYRHYWPDMDLPVMEGGYNVLNRAVVLAFWLGFRRVVVAGGDFGARDPERAYYAPGAQGKAGNEGAWLTDHGKLDGTPWFTKADLMASAGHLALQIKAGAPVKVLGDSVTNALLRHDVPTIQSASSLNFAA